MNNIYLGLCCRDGPGSVGGLDLRADRGLSRQFLQKKQFLYTGPDINAVLDRLPTAKAVKQKDGSYLVDVEVFGSIGLTMWLNSQGDYVKILS